MKHKSRFLLPILTLLTFGMVTGSVVAAGYKKDEIPLEEADAAISGSTLYFENYWNYSKPHVHYWGGTSSSTWPGPSLTDTGFDLNWSSASRNILSTTVASGTTNVKFSNDGDNPDPNNNDGYTIPDGANMMIQREHKWVYWDGVTDCWGGQTRTVYFARKGWEYWSESYVHAWNVGLDGTDGSNSPQMDYEFSYDKDDGTHYLYSYDLPSYCIDFIFKNANGSTDKEVRTSLALNATKSVYDGDAAEWKPLLTYVNQATSTSIRSVMDNNGTLPTGVEAGFTPAAHKSFKEWNTAPDGSGASYKAGDTYSGGDATLYAIWDNSVYTISLIQGDPTEAGSTAFYEKYNTGFYLDEDCTQAMTTLANPIDVPEKYGYDFNGYYLYSSGLGKQFIDANGYLMNNLQTNYFTANQSVFAYWVGHACTITFDQNGATSGGITESPTFYYNSDITNYASSGYSTPVLTGHIFTGYFDENGKQYYYSDFSRKTVVWDKVVDTCTLYAGWAVCTATVTFNKNEGTGGSNSVTATYGESMPAATMPTRAGYSFDGYYDSSEFQSATKYYNADGSSARIWDKEDASITLYAKWIKDMDYEIVSNDYIGYTFTMSQQYISSQGYHSMKVTRPDPSKLEDATTVDEKHNIGSTSEMIYVKVNSAQLNDPVKIEFFTTTDCSGKAADTIENTVAEVIAGNVDEDNKDLYESMLVYGHFAQSVFGRTHMGSPLSYISTDDKSAAIAAANIAVPVVDGDSRAQADTCDFHSYKIRGGNDGTDGALLFRYIFDSDDFNSHDYKIGTLTGLSNATAVLTTCTDNTSTVHHCIEIRGIKASEIHNLFTVTILDGEDTAFSLTHSYQNYLNKVVTSTAGATDAYSIFLNRFAKATYYYYTRLSA